MKELRKNIKYLLGVMVVCFILLTGYLVYDAVIWGNRWLNSPYTTPAAAAARYGNAGRHL